MTTATQTAKAGLNYGWTLGEDNWNTTPNGGVDENWQIVDAISWNQWAQKRSTTTGLTYGFYGGSLYNAGWTTVADGTVSLTNNATNYVERDAQTGAVSANTSGFTAAKLPMAAVTCISGAITAVSDRRVAWMPVYNLYVGNNINQAAGTAALQAVTATSMTATGTIKSGAGMQVTGSAAATASAIVLTMADTSHAWIVGVGPDASTNASLQLHSQRSDGSNDKTLLAFDGSTLAATMIGALAINGPFTGATTGVFSSTVQTGAGLQVKGQAGATASAMVMTMVSSSQGWLVALGPDTSTNASLQLHSQRSDGTNDKTFLAFDGSTLAATLAGALAMNGPLTGVTSLTASGTVQAGTGLQVKGSSPATASAIVLTMASTSQGWLVVLGPDTSTNASFQLHSQRSDGSNDLTFMTVSAAGAFAFPQLATTGSAANAFIDPASNPKYNFLQSTSSLRFKRDVKSISLRDAARIIMGLRPIDFESTAAADNKRRFLGFGAEEVAKHEDRLALRDRDGLPINVLYDHVTAPITRLLQELWRFRNAAIRRQPALA